MKTYIRDGLKFDFIEADSKTLADIYIESYSVGGSVFSVTTHQRGVVVVSGNGKTATSLDNGLAFTLAERSVFWKDAKTISVPNKEDLDDSTLIHIYNLTSLIKAML